MHKNNIVKMRDEAKRQLQLLKLLLQKADQKGLVAAAAINERDRATFDKQSLSKTLEILDGEAYKLDHLDMVLAVVGTMKAGKSTSINAIVGAEVLPNRNRPMTALPTLIRHTPQVLEPRLTLEKLKPLNDLLKNLHHILKSANSDVLSELREDTDMKELLEQIEGKKPISSHHEGEEKIFNFLKRLNDLVRLSAALNVEFPFDEYANIDAMPVIEVEFTHLKNIPVTQGRLTLLDTPGPNEDGQLHLRPMLKDQLKKSSAVLAIFDYTQLKSDADAEVRKHLIEIAASAKDRMYALINKFDQKKRNDDDESTLKKNVAQNLMKGTLTAQNVFPVSSSQGYLASRALNEMERYGSLNVQQPWVADFAKEAIGRQWEKKIHDSQEVKDAARELWEQSGFGAPLKEVIVMAYQNASLEALRSAASKLDEIAKNAGDFFKTNVVSFKKSATELRNSIDNLQKDIENIIRIEKSTEEALKASLEEMRGNIDSSANNVQEEIRKKLKEYFAEGKRIEFDNQSKNPNKKKAKPPKEQPEQKANGPAWPFASSSGQSSNILTNLFGQSSTKDDKEHADRDFDPSSPIIKFDRKSEANDFRDKIEKSIRFALNQTEENIKDHIQSGIDEFSKTLEVQCVESLKKIQESAQKNIEGFDIKIQMPNARSIKLDTSISNILKDAIEEKSKTVTRYRRKSGAWGEVCRWFKTDDWGWEDYQATEEYYQVDLHKISASSENGVEIIFKSAKNSLEKIIYPELQTSVDYYFVAFRQKIEHVRGDLMEGMQRHKLDQAQKDEIIKTSEALLREASGIEVDCNALNVSADTLRREQKTTTTKGEVLA